MLIKCFYILILMLISIGANAAHLYYAGFSYLGESKLIPKKFPYTSQVNGTYAGVSAFDAELRRKFEPVDLAKLGIVLGELADIQNEDTLAITLALESEMISVEKIDGQYKLLIQLSAQIMIFDFKEMKIVSTHPIDVQFNDSLASKPTERDILKRVKGLYFGDSKANILDVFVGRLGEISPEKKYSNHLKVVNVRITDRLKNKLGDVSQQQVVQSLGQTFTRYLSVNQLVSVLPFTKGHAVGNKLAGQYANGEVYMMELPDPDYAIDITLTGLNKKLYSQNSAGKAYVYAAQVDFKFYEPLTESVFFTGKIYNGATKKVPSTQETVDDWPSYYETLLGLFDKFTRVLDKPNKGWLKKHSGQTSNYKEFKSIQKVIENCR